MSITKQTAVEWLVEELTKNGHNFKLYKKEIEQAKEMEKQQIMDAYNELYVSTGEQYYNETFKNK